MKEIALLIILLTFTNCRYFNVSPVNGITTKNLTEKPTQEEMIGVWELDKFSYDLIEQKKYEKKKVELKLNSNGTFEITNLPNFVNVFDETTEKNINTIGTWKIGKDFKEENWVLNMSDIFIQPFDGIVASNLQINNLVIPLTPVVALLFYIVAAFILSELLKSFSRD